MKMEVALPHVQLQILLCLELSGDPDTCCWYTYCWRADGYLPNLAHPYWCVSGHRTRKVAPLYFNYPASPPPSDTQWDTCWSHLIFLKQNCFCSGLLYFMHLILVRQITLRSLKENEQNQVRRDFLNAYSKAIATKKNLGKSLVSE